MKYFMLILLLIIGTMMLIFNTLDQPKRIIWSDSEGYYMYLPSVFIYKDFVKEALVDTAYIRPFQDTGKIFSKYTCGVAILELPFFLGSHLYSKIRDLPADGKTDVYGRGLCISGAFYLWFGMLFLYFYLKKYYSTIIIITSLLAIMAGTNLYYYTFFAPGMSHVYSFFLFSVFLWLTDLMFIQKLKIYNNFWFSWAVFGLLYGMIVLVRPTNIIIGLIPLYILVQSENDFYVYVKQNLKYILLAMGCFLISWIPQFLYWKYISGKWVIWSYSNEGFPFWTEPKLLRVLFDPWNGWILYSPIVVLPLLFLWQKRISNDHFARIYLYVFLFATYIFASWWAWWFGGAFGHRSYVEFLALLAFPFAGLIQQAFLKKWRGILLSVLILLFCYYNLALTYVYQPPWDGPSWTYESWWNVVKNLFVF